MSDVEDYDDLVSGQESATDTSGKYFCINVPDYEDSISTVASDKQSYLRVGAATTDWSTEPGADLAGLAYLAGAAGRVTSGDGGYSLAEATNAVAALSSVYTDVTAKDLHDPFIDDQRERGTGNARPDGADGHGFSTTERRADSAVLHSDVGWRDHTDGNRISTTRGDKVEVVYGNYKLIVMGRQADPGCAQGWEANGDHIQDFADGTMPGASVTVEWVPDTTYGSSGAGGSKGAWLLQNSTERVYQYSRNAGNFREQNWGDLIETYTGSENPETLGTTSAAGMSGHPTYRDEGLGSKTALAPSVDSTGLPRGNPTIIERTWAKKIDSKTGSDGHRVPEIHEETWTDSAYSKTMATSSYSTQWSDVIQDYLVASHYIIEGATTPLHMRGFGGGVIDTFVGPRFVFELATSVQITGVLKFEASFGWSWAYHNWKDEMALLENKITGVDNQIVTTRTLLTALMDTKVSNAKTEITAATDIKVNNLETSIANANTRIDGTDTRINNLSTNLGKLILLG